MLFLKVKPPILETLMSMKSARRLTAGDAAVIKGMLARGDLQSDIAAWFRCNGGRISEINTGKTFCDILAVPVDKLPPPGPYQVGA